MANEYLKRKPTSTGNRKVWTWSTWHKRNSTGSYINFYTTQSQTPYLSVGNFLSDDRIQLCRNESATVTEVNTSNVFRDVGSWMHLMIVWDTTLATASERCKLYVNGVLQSNTTGTYPTQNYEASINWVVDHTIGTVLAGGSPVVSAKAEYTDVFLVDGQALTPEVFGFYKDGNGYISAGSTQATDFRNGQWVPKKPKLIIDEINASGGFGVNGFYLPMNSSNNFGADFHTTPNTILKLKDNLPQPKAEIDGSGDYSGDIRDDLGGLPFPGVVKFDGDGDYLSTPHSTDLTFGSGNFTIEMWMNPQIVSGKNNIVVGIWDDQLSGPQSWVLYFDTSGNLRFLIDVFGGDIQIFTSPPKVNENTWSHIAVSRQNNNWYMFINGTLSATGTNSSFMSVGSAPLQIGTNQNILPSNVTYSGYISNLRILKGTALYTENFTPPTQPLQKTTDTVLLCCNSKTDPTNEETGKTITKNGDVYATTSELTDALVLAIPFVSGGLQNGFGDYSAAIKGRGTPKTITNNGVTLDTSGSYNNYYNGSGAFNRASAPYLSVPDGDDFEFGSGDFTIEFWMYLSSSTQRYEGIMSKPGTADQSGWLILKETQDNFIKFLATTGSPTNWNVIVRFITSTSLAGQWNHFAVTRKGSLFTAYVNGVATSTDIEAGALVNNSGNLEIGRYAEFPLSLTYGFDGYIQDLRVYKGIAKYKGGFDVPKPYTPVGIGTWRAVPDTTANNFATLNPLQVNKLTFSDGNLSWSTPINTYSYGQGTISVPKTGKWVFEGRFNHNTSNINYNSIGVGTTNPVVFPFTIAGNYGINDAGPTFGQSFVQNGVRQGSITLGSGDIIQVLIDRDNNQMNFVKNGTLQTGTGSNVTIPSYVDLYTMIGEYNVWGQINFGQNPTFSGKIGNNVRINSSNGSWDQTPNTGLHNDWTISNDGRNLDVVVSSGYYARAYLYLDPNEKYLLSFDYVSGPANLGVLTDTKGYLTSVNGSVSPNGLSQGNSYVFEISNANWVNITGFNSQTYNIDNIYLTRVVPGYSDSNGKGEFRYEPPAGFLALCEDNLPTPAIKNPGEYFKTVLWTGDSANGRSITGVGFKPDLVWIKNRANGVANSWHSLSNSVTPGRLFSNESNPEDSFKDVGSFDIDGMTINYGTYVNTSGGTYVAWCWKAGGPAVTNTDGTITSQVSANQDAGFSIVSWTGTGSAGTIGHSLNKIPKFIITKSRDSAINWVVYHNYTGSGNKLELNATTASASTNAWNSTEPTSNVFSIGNTTAGATNGEKYIAYCWAEIEGFSKFGSYVGNGDPDGPFVYCGFKPAFILLKPTNLTDNWLIADNARSSTNINQTWLYPNSSTTEGIQNGLDFLSNGFKLRNSNGGRNGDGITYIFIAFAESPFQYANSK